VIESKPRVVALIPAYNEGKVIFDTIAPIIQAGYKVVCIDDGSTDNTATEAMRANAIVVKHQLNLGQGAALETGLEYLRRNPETFEYAITFDADGQHALLDIAEMIKVSKDSRAHVVLGTRFGHIPFQGGWLKAILLKLSARIAQISLGIEVTDRHNGLRLFDKEAVQKIKLRVSGFGHADEILRLISENKISYVECPVNIVYTEYSKSKGQPLINLLNIVFDRVLGPK
jgi:glycosyltransferase involved in cell wall biosynthesis